jgi:NAD(P)-dependent dehydrogenase (short-subunit alcohol dehydrogenase family)
VAGIAPATDPYYGAAKHALIGLTRSFARILRTEHIRVNAICPGFIDIRLIDVVRETLTTHEIAIADADYVAQSWLAAHHGH